MATEQTFNPNEAADTVPAIGVLDSGVGGLTIYTAIRQRLPMAHYSYCSDNANFPYGLRAEADVIKCAEAVAERYVARCGLDLLVVACNTISTVALPRLRAKLSIPVIGVVPAIKPAAQLTQTGTIALLATPGTVARTYIDDLIAAHAAHCRVLKVGASKLMELAEQKMRGHQIDLDTVRAEIAPLFVTSAGVAAKLDTVVLGCTHFPLLIEELQAAAAWPVRWIDSTEAIAARAHYLLSQAGTNARLRRGVDAPSAKPIAYMTRLGHSTAPLLPTLERLGFGGLEEV